MRNNTIFRRVFAGCFLMLALATAMPAQAGLAVTPTTLIIQGRDRYADLSVINTDKKLHSYALEWRFYRMEQDSGNYTNIAASTTDFDLSQHLIFSPRRIALAPESAQKIRFALRLNGDEPLPGDYRAHFMVRELPQDNPAVPENPEDMQALAQGKKRVTAGVNINFGFTFPVVYRVGESTDIVTIENVKVARDPKTEKITVAVPVVKTKSAFGMYGNLSIDLIDGAKITHLGGLNNANIFPEITRRLFNVALNVPALQSGTLRVSVSDRNDEKNVFASKDIPIK